MSEEQEIYTPSEAVKYLREERGIIFTVDSLRNRRRNKQAQAHRVLINNSLWTKTELDAIEPSRKTKRVEKVETSQEKPLDRSQPRGKRVKKNAVAAHNPSMMLKEFGQPLNDEAA